MGGSTGKCGKCHDEDAGSYSGLQFITQDRGQDQQHHHTAAGADETADEADQHTAYQRLDGSFFAETPCMASLVVITGRTMNLIPNRKVMNTEKFPMVAEGTRLDT